MPSPTSSSILIRSDLRNLRSWSLTLSSGFEARGDEESPVGGLFALLPDDDGGLEDQEDAVAFHRTADLGTPELGKIADLVLLDANPLAAIENTQHINSVIEDGRLYRRSDLYKLLSGAEHLAAIR